MIKQLLYREIFLVTIICGCLIQCLKALIYSIADKKVNIGKLFQADGLPNLHSVVFSSLSTGIGIKYGVSSIIFSFVTTYSVIIIYDTLRLKGEKGKQVDVLNRIISGLDPYRGVGTERGLRVLHFRPLDVMSGVVLGIVGAYLLL